MGQLQKDSSKLHLQHAAAGCCQHRQEERALPDLFVNSLFVKRKETHGDPHIICSCSLDTSSHSKFKEISTPCCFTSHSALAGDLVVHGQFQAGLQVAQPANYPAHNPVAMPQTDGPLATLQNSQFRDASHERHETSKASCPEVRWCAMWGSVKIGRYSNPGRHAEVKQELARAHLASKAC